MTDIAAPVPRAGFAAIWPGLLSAVAFAMSDVLVKFALSDGANPATALSIRGAVGLVLVAVWLQIGPPRKPLTRKQILFACGIGVVFAGNVYLLFTAIAATTVAFSILVYFLYPLLTGLAAAALRIDTLTWRSVVTAGVALLGLALMIGASPAGILWLGAALSVGAALLRTVTLITSRLALQGADLRSVTWYNQLVSTLVFVAVMVVMQSWVPPHTPGAWIAVVSYGITMVVGIAGLFASTARIGPFQTAMLMNLEPPLAALISAVTLGETLTPLQLLGGAIMLGATTLFQMRK